MIFYFFPLLAAALGWLLALLMLRLFLSPRLKSRFTLKSQIRIWKPELAEVAGACVEKQMSPARLMESLSGPALGQAVQSELESKVSSFIKERLPEKWPMLGMFLNADTLEKIRAGLMEELQEMLPGFLHKLSGTLAANIPARRIVEQKIQALSEMEILEYIKTKHSKMASGMQWAGALIGLLIGLAAVFCFKIFLP
jgi:hypothetical protein